MSTAITPAGRLISWGLGVNEASSAINIGRFIGSIFTQPEDSKVIEDIAGALQL